MKIVLSHQIWVQPPHKFYFMKFMTIDQGHNYMTVSYNSPVDLEMVHIRGAKQIKNLQSKDMHLFLSLYLCLSVSVSASTSGPVCLSLCLSPYVRMIMG